MKRTMAREITIDIETIRATRKRSARKKQPEPAKPDISNQSKTDARLQRFFDDF